MRGEQQEKLLELLPKLVGTKTVVLGDLFLDEYIVGRASRLSREAPIPVLEFRRKFYRPGGAANPAQNISALEGTVQVVGVVGDDQAGRQLLGELDQANLERSAVVTDPTRPTTTKTRVVGETSLRFPQQLARVDRLDRTPLSEAVEAKVVRHLRALVPRADLVLVSDYRTGVATPNVVGELRELANRYEKLLTVDSQGDLYKYRGYHLVKCNRAEAEAALNTPLRTEGDFRLAARELLGDLSARGVVITRGADGMSVVGPDISHTHLPVANRSEVFDVTGAGDTVIAIASLALAAGADLLAACYLANHAAGLVVRRMGNAVATQEELAWAIRNW